MRNWIVLIESWIIVLLFVSAAGAGDTWVLWANTGRRPQAAATFDDKDSCVAASRAEAEAYVARSTPHPKMTLDVVPFDAAGTAVRSTLAPPAKLDFVAATYRCWPVGVNPQ